MKSLTYWAFVLLASIVFLFTVVMESMAAGLGHVVYECLLSTDGTCFISVFTRFRHLSNLSRRNEVKYNVAHQRTVRLLLFLEGIKEGGKLISRALEKWAVCHFLYWSLQKHLLNLWCPNFGLERRHERCISILRVILVYLDSLWADGTRWWDSMEGWVLTVNWIWYFFVSWFVWFIDKFGQFAVCSFWIHV